MSTELGACCFLISFLAGLNLPGGTLYTSKVDFNTLLGLFCGDNASGVGAQDGSKRFTGICSPLQLMWGGALRLHLGPCPSDSSKGDLVSQSIYENEEKHLSQQGS